MSADAWDYEPPPTHKAKDGRATRQELLTFVSAFRRAVEKEYQLAGTPPDWLRHGYDNARELLGLADSWPAPWEERDV